MSHIDANEYVVARHTAREARPPGICWVEVYDSEPGWGNTKAVRLKAGYISEAQDTLEQLCAMLPLEQWANVFCMTPGCVGGEVYFLGQDLSRLSRNALKQELDRAKEIIYHNEQRGFEKLQMVIVSKSQNGVKMKTFV